MKRFAILLGCEEYKDYKNYSAISYCHADVNLLEETLINCCDFAKQDIYCELLNIYDERTPENILDEIRKLLDKSEPGDTILFYYSGHGDNVDGESYLVLPYTQRDNITQTGLPLRDISGLLRKNDRINVRIFDCCHSGQDVRSSKGKIDNKTFMQDIANSNNDGWITLASCREDEYSYPNNGFGHGVFTYYLVESIKEFNEDDEIYPELLKLKVVDKVLKWNSTSGNKQTPTFNSSIAGNISIARRKKAIEKQKDKVEDNQINSNKDGIISRIKAVRSIKSIKDEDNLKKLKNYIEFIYDKITHEQNSIEKFDNDLIISDIQTADEIPSHLQPLIINYLKSRKFEVSHEYKVEKIYKQKREQTNFLKFNHPLYNPFDAHEPEVEKIKYSIEQDWDLPQSYLDVIVDDQYFPEGRMFIYICPLKISACLISGISIGDEDKWNNELLDTIFLKMNEKEDLEKIQNQVCELIKKFNKAYQESIEKNLKYYEWEQKL
ncbi:caspase family protein [Clostridium sp. A1-XYC3]|uniref:Caspase family protein n=1 Tax=Clostridium tanneri TaxID=3037988 RepID=A0ABU4JWZ5_9CLOT|nr:caspase family protein [Clostridium sp. A1-XYC3]MDW8802647.1 caspase family protein [Clostridium sp. A1-XYC3]